MTENMPGQGPTTKHAEGNMTDLSFVFDSISEADLSTANMPQDNENLAIATVSDNSRNLLSFDQGPLVQLNSFGGVAVLCLATLMVARRIRIHQNNRAKISEPNNGDTTPQPA